MMIRAGCLHIRENRGVDDKFLQDRDGTITGNQGQAAILGKIGGIFLEMFENSAVTTAMTFESDRNKVDPAKQKSQPMYDINGDTPEAVAILKRYLLNGEIASFRYYARQVGSKPSGSQEVLDGLAEIIWEERNNDDKYIVDGLCHLCRTFQLSRQPRYKSFFEWLNENGSTYKLRRYARKASKYILPANVSQFQPWKEEKKVAEAVKTVEVAEAIEVEKTTESAEVVKVDGKAPTVVPGQKSSNLRTIPELDTSASEIRMQKNPVDPKKRSCSAFTLMNWVMTVLASLQIPNQMFQSCSICRRRISDLSRKRLTAGKPKVNFINACFQKLIRI